MILQLWSSTWTGFLPLSSCWTTFFSENENAFRVSKNKKCPFAKRRSIILYCYEMNFYKVMIVPSIYTLSGSLSNDIKKLKKFLNFSLRITKIILKIYFNIKKIKYKQDGWVILLHCNVQVSITDGNQFLNRKM
jgi:hypothetical protein